MRDVLSIFRGRGSKNNNGDVEHARTLIQPDSNSQTANSLTNSQDNTSNVTEEETPISNHDIDKVNVILLDISSNKKWVAYVTTNITDQKKTCLTLRKFTEMTSNTNNQQTNKPHISLDISKLLKDGGANYCKFLSVSPNGKYVALSFMERNVDGTGRNKKPQNADCLIFSFGDTEVNKITTGNVGRIEQFQGRAVFLDRKNENEATLLLIDLETIKVYDKFTLSTKKPTQLFDLKSLASDRYHAIEEFLSDRSYIKYASWMWSTSNQNSPKNDSPKIHNDIIRLMSYSRHIRHDVLTTHFKNGGIARIWSLIEDGARLTSFPAPNEDITAFSKDYRYIATYVKEDPYEKQPDNTQCINIYNVKSGLLVYKLKSRHKKQSPSCTFEVLHLRFFYDARYLAMSGVERPTEESDNATTKVIFEVWYIQTEQSIYCKSFKVTLGSDPQQKIVQPFAMRIEEIDQVGNKVNRLKGFYTTKINSNGNDGNNNSNDISSRNDDRVTDISQSRTKTICVTLDIDKEEPQTEQENDLDVDITFKWDDEKCNPKLEKELEIERNLDETEDFRCGHFVVGGKEYLVRFGKHMVQLWHCGSLWDRTRLISDDDQLVYIRAYKGPNYGLEYSFRKIWRIHSFKSAKFIKGYPAGRMLVNITEEINNIESSTTSTYHTEELFLPLHQLVGMYDTSETNYHQLESACQALHYLHNIKINRKSDNEDQEAYDKYKKKKHNYDMIYKKTRVIINTSISSIDRKSNFFSTIGGSRALAMLASFEDGRDIIKLILAKNVLISIFSYTRSISQLTETDLAEEVDRRNIKKNEGDNNDNRNNIGNGSEIAVHRNSPRIETNESPSQCKLIGTKIATNENVMTVLIDEGCYKLHKLIFIRILLDSQKLGLGCLSALTDALLFLQEQGNTKLLLDSTKLLSYISMDKDKMGILKSEVDSVLKVKGVQKEFLPSLRNLESHATMEQIKKYKVRSIAYTFYSWKKYLKESNHIWKKWVKGMLPWSNTTSDQEEGQEDNELSASSETNQKGSSGLTKICVVPLPHFNSYSTFPEDRPKGNNQNDNSMFPCKRKDNNQNNNSVIPYKPKSAFIRVASYGHDNNMFQQGDTVLEVLIQYKWNKFASWRFWGIVCSIHLLYYITYTIAVLFPQQVFGYEAGNTRLHEHPRHLATVILMFASGLALVGQEVRQFHHTHGTLNYFQSWYNYVDICAFCFPFFTFIMLIFGWPYLAEVGSVTTLILWIHGILRLRVVSFVGITIEIVVRLVLNVWKVLLLMFLIVCMFTSSLIILLRNQPDTFFQETYNGTAFDGAIYSNITIQDVSSSNRFTDVYKAFYAVWFFVFGAWDAISGGNAGDDEMLMAYGIVFSLITSLIFFNIVIAYMSSTIDEVKQRGNKVWVRHFADVVSEIELLWCHKGAKRSRRNNPTYIFYIANYDAVTSHEEELYKMKNELQEALSIKVETEDKSQ